MGDPLQVRSRKPWASSCVGQRKQVLIGRRGRGSRMAVSMELDLIEYLISLKNMLRGFTLLEEILG